MMVGAAKSGTTAIATYLSKHPQVFLTPLKEPKFISSQFLTYPLNGPGDQWVQTIAFQNLSDYLKLYRNVREEEAIGEASVENLIYYREAIPLIQKYFGDVKIIIILRNPIDRAFSAYMHLCRDLRETLSFEEALEAETERSKNNWDHIWFYKAGGMYAEGVEAYQKAFSRVKVMILDDFKTDRAAFLRELFSFLEVNPDFEVNTSKRFNVSGVPRSNWIQRIFKPGILYAWFYRKMVMYTGLKEDWLLGIIENLWRFNLRPIRMNPETRRQLARDFANDNRRLSQLLGRDLSNWLQ